MDRKIKGITLIELLFVIAIIAVILAIAVPTFSKWVIKYRVESDMRTIQSLLQEARLKAFSEKINLSFEINGSSACYKCDPDDTVCTNRYGGNCIKTSDLNYNYGNININITNRGVFSNQITIRYTETNDVSIDCVSVSNLRVKVGKYNGTTCQ